MRRKRTAEEERARRLRRLAADPDFDRKKDERKAWGVSGVYAALVAHQGEQCGICGTTTPGGMGRFHIDHCHETGVVRGLLCSKHNGALGVFGDNVEGLRNALAYLLDPPCVELGFANKGKGRT